ncbi:hypothetical protein A7U60_g1554 [Sanghuangporus baumii]|uniref:Coenzyme Q-binding protein COQ10 START domain-containing protein n=1 Tax=Sanghuangporus baumii TaxID=108892 RepID=A0A9Q5I4V1_SANBA|nr:hypothetical protein A7U60_g1554 [Sanghuangporus baumii]
MGSTSAAIPAIVSQLLFTRDARLTSMKLHSGLLPRRPLASSSALQHNKSLHAFRRTVFQIPQLASLFPSSGLGAKGREQRYSKRKILPYSQKQLYRIIADVDNYQHFLPYCTESKVLTKWRVKADPDQRVVKQEARLTVGFLAFKESYVSEVTCRPYHSVEAIASSGTPLFRKLVTTWCFQPADPSSPHPVKTGVPKDKAGSSTSQPLETAAHADLVTPDHPSSPNGPTLLSIDLVFAFANPVYAAASAAFFRDVSSMMVEAFEKRCMEVYGPGTK